MVLKCCHSGIVEQRRSTGDTLEVNSAHGEVASLSSCLCKCVAAPGKVVLLLSSHSKGRCKPVSAVAHCLACGELGNSRQFWLEVVHSDLREQAQHLSCCLCLIRLQHQ